MNAAMVAKPVLDPETNNLLGASHFAAGRYGEAEDCFRAALDADERHFGAWSNLGLTYQHCGFLEEAQKCYLRALEINSRSAETVTCIGFLTQQLGHLEAARALFERALEYNPECDDAKCNLGILDLMEFKYDTGWERWESRWGTKPPQAKWRDFGKPIWDGSRTECVAIWPDQGIGDMILFSTLLPDLIARDQAFIMEVDERLIDLYRASFPKAVFVLRDDAERWGFMECSAAIPLSSLGRILRPTRESFWVQPYRLFVTDAERRSTASERKRIAISWRSFLPSKGVRIEREKSGSLAMFKPLAADFDLVDVQYGNVSIERAEADFHVSTCPGIDFRRDLAAVVNIIDGCDAVVTTCNVTAHIGGALGKPTFVMYRGKLAPLFSWQPTERGRSIWYPSARIINDGDWPELIDRVKVALQ